MTDNDVDQIYKAMIGVSHYAALRAVFDAGWYAALVQPVTSTTVDASATAVPVTTDVTITNP